MGQRNIGFVSFLIRDVISTLVQEGLSGGEQGELSVPP